jgi:hypothetical protein
MQIQSGRTVPLINKETKNCKNHQCMYKKYLFNIISAWKISSRDTIPVNVDLNGIFFWRPGKGGGKWCLQQWAMKIKDEMSHSLHQIIGFATLHTLSSSTLVSYGKRQGIWEIVLLCCVQSRKIFLFIVSWIISKLLRDSAMRFLLPRFFWANTFKLFPYPRFFNFGTSPENLLTCLGSIFVVSVTDHQKETKNSQISFSIFKKPRTRTWFRLNFSLKISQNSLHFLYCSHQRGTKSLRRKIDVLESLS